MNTVVWIMIMVAHGNNFSTGPEFSTQEKCERAVVTIHEVVDKKFWVGPVRKPFCVRIEK